MKQRALIIFLSLLALVVAMVSPTLADDASCTADPNDGSALPECGTPADNACYEGGVMESKCVGDWEWKAGWHLARFLAGVMTREQVPQDFQIVLPPPAEPGTEPLRLCINESGSGITARACVSSDQTGWLTATDGQTTITLSLLFVTGDSPAACPTSFNQLALVQALPTGMVVMSLVSAQLFTQEELDALRLQSVLCLYADPNAIGGRINTDAAVQFASSL
jgi:hypothetical protein